MYPGPLGSPENHKCGYCSDGIKSSSKIDTLPDWPQPQGIFISVTDFDPIEFLVAIKAMYERTVLEKEDTDNMSVEYKAFTKLLEQRLVVLGDGTILFKLYEWLSFTLGTPDGLVVDHNGSKYLRVDCLQNV